MSAGFTLVEIMVALAVVGIMSSLAYFKVTAYRDQTRLRQSAEKIHQLLGWSKLMAEKKGDTILVKFALPTISVYQDANGTGKWEATDPVILADSILSNVATYKPAVAPSEASVSAPASGMADGTGSCVAGTCFTQGASTPGWSDGYVNFCARISPSLSPLVEDGAIYLASSNSSVKEVWAIVFNRSKSSEPTMWVSDKAPVAATDWRKIR